MLARFLIIFLTLINGASNDEVTIEWNENRKLSWADFKGPVEANSDAVAVTASGITFSFSVRESGDRFTNFKAQASAHFYPEKSWYNKKKATDHILAHEQLHFDITELHVRRLRYEISKLKISQNIKRELRQLHEDANADLAKMQRSYDAQSEHSINKKQQAIWAEFVRTELHKYRAFRSR